MKTEQEIKKQLEEIYNHRLSLRIERKLKPTCKNCKHGCKKMIDLGSFGLSEYWDCTKDNCDFECKYTQDFIEQEMINDISDPSICGAKEPKIAALLWVLHDGKKEEEEIKEQKGKVFFEESKEESKTFWQRIFGK